jgi:hypothetical protein
MRDYDQYSGRGFRIRVDRQQPCTCGAPWSPHGVSVEPDFVEHQCLQCHRVVLSVELEPELLTVEEAAE